MGSTSGETSANSGTNINHNTNTLICTVGLPRSGKSTWAQKQGVPVVCPDAIRLALHGERFLAQAEPWVWTIAHTMVESLFLAGHETVILDATSISRTRRDAWRSRKWDTKFALFTTPPEVCMQRAVDTDRADLIPVIKRMFVEFERLGDDEGVW